MDAYCKLAMNSQYGKHGQKAYPHVLIGGKNYMFDTMDELMSHDSIQNVQVYVIPTQAFDLFQIKFDLPG